MTTKYSRYTRHDWFLDFIVPVPYSKPINRSKNMKDFALTDYELVVLYRRLFQKETNFETFKYCTVQTKERTNGMLPTPSFVISTTVDVDIAAKQKRTNGSIRSKIKEMHAIAFLKFECRTNFTQTRYITNNKQTRTNNIRWKTIQWNQPQDTQRNVTQRTPPSVGRHEHEINTNSTVLAVAKENRDNLVPKSFFSPRYQEIACCTVCRLTSRITEYIKYVRSIQRRHSTTTTLATIDGMAFFYFSKSSASTFLADTNAATRTSKPPPTTKKL